MPTLPAKKMVPTLLALIAAGVVGNYFAYPLFFGIEFLFGGIFAMLALQLCGGGPGIIAALVIGGVTVLRCHHPYLLLVGTAEVAVVWWLGRRRALGFVLADAIYWLCLGTPLIYLLYRGLLQVSAYNLPIAMFKQAVNGITNTLIARLVYMGMMLRVREAHFLLREVVFNLLACFMLIPALVFITHESREEFAIIDQGVRDSLTQGSRLAKDGLELWLGQKSSRMRHLAWMVANGMPDQQGHLDYLRDLDPDLSAIGIIDRNAISTAFSPATDEQGRSSIGKDFSDRPYLTELKRTLQPHLSDVVLSKIGPPDPIVILSAPVVERGRYQGYVAGILNLQRVRRILTLNETKYGLRCTLLDRNGKVIATNRGDLEVLATLPRREGDLIPIGPDMSHWLPAGPGSPSAAERWSQSVYIVEQGLNDLSGWRLVTEQSLTPILERLYVQYAGELQLIFAILLVTLIFAELFSRRVLASIDSLQTITAGLPERLSTNLPERLAAVQGFDWPTSLIQEVNQLVGNFREMSLLLAQKFTEADRLKLTLEQRVEERTGELQESEAKYRIIFENKMYAIYIFDLATFDLLDANEAFLRLYEYDREELRAGLSIRDISGWSGEVDSAIYDALSEGSIFVPQRYHRKKDGTIFPVEIAGGSYVWHGRQVMFAIAHDITDRKRAAEALMERTIQLEALTRHLEIKVAEEVDRRRRQEQLVLQQAKLAAMGEMLGAIAHQWRQPLNSLGLCVQNIKDSFRYGELNQAYLDATVREAMEQIHHMSQTVDDFRNFFRADKEKVPFDTMQAVADVLVLLSAQLTANGIDCSLTCKTHQRTFATMSDIDPCPAKVVVGYKNEFEHVILNLVSNARDAICACRDQGGLEATEGQGLITFEFENRDELLVITVSDNGGGIPAHLLDRVFEPYFTTKEPNKGTGIGLYLSKIIIEDHMYGSLAVENTEQGASFVITMPTTEAGESTSIN